MSLSTVFLSYGDGGKMMMTVCLQSISVYSCLHCLHGKSALSQ